MNILDYELWRDDQKNKKLIAERWISFEEIRDCIYSGWVKWIIDNPSQNHENQKLIIVIVNDYPFAIPCIISWRNIIMKTIFPCRKYK